MDFVADNVTSTDGGGIADTARKLLTAPDLGDAAAQGVSAGLEFLGTVTDPFASLMSAGIGWAIEHCEPLRTPLDELAGDPRAIDEGSRAWFTRSEELKTTADDIRQRANAETAEWQGDAGDAYRKAATALAEHVESMSEGANGVAGGIRNAGVLVATVRALIRDLITDLIAKAIQTLAVSMGLSFVTAGVSLGAGISWLAGKVGITVGKVAQKLSNLVSKLSDMLGNMGRLSGALAEVGNRASRLAATGAAHMDNLASQVGSSQIMRNAFNGTSSSSINQGIDKAADFTSPSSFERGRIAGTLEFSPNPTGDAIKTASEAGKNIAEVDDKTNEDKEIAQERASKEQGGDD
ncbi:WXG100 family type VII secretion target [Bounagaea algeriensis]